MGYRSLEHLISHLSFPTRHDGFEPIGDSYLLQRYIGQSDELAFGEVVRRHGAMVWAVCRRILGPCQDAEDVYQVTILKLVRQATLIQRYKSVAGWLHTAARNVAITTQRKRDRQRVCRKRRQKMFEEGYIDRRNTKDFTDILDEELGYLPQKCQSPIILCYLEGLTPEQAACRINISTTCLKRRLAEGRQRLHQRLSQRGINLDSPMLVAGLTLNLHSQQVPPRLMEKTLHMVRILTQSNSALEPPSNSDGVMTLAKKTLETWTLKAKLLLALLLVTLVLAGGGLITYSGWWSFRGEQPQKEMHGPAKKTRHSPETHETRLPRTDDDAALLPPQVLGRVGNRSFVLEYYPGTEATRARRGSPDPAARRPQVSPSSYMPDRMPSWNDTACTSCSARIS